LEPKVFSVTELQRTVQAGLEESFGDVWVQGEVSDPRIPRSGHCYLTLKDEGARLGCVLWRTSFQRLKFEIEGGLAVRAHGYLTVYPPTGRYQMIVRSLEPVGKGSLQVRFEQLCRRLEEEGLFDPGHKRPLPRYPRRVALITSPTGAAVRDLIHVCLRRWPGLELVVVPVRVQGAGAAEEIAAGIALADRRGFDVLVVGRGGGALEDLWAFNEEVTARAVFRARTPVVSAVGHEVDVTICDLVADKRAATPSAAAEAVAPEAAEALRLLGDLRRRLIRAQIGRIAAMRRSLDEIRRARALRRPLEFLREAALGLDGLEKSMARALRETLDRHRRGLEGLAGRLEALSPLGVLARGYSVTLRRGRVLTRAAEARPGDRLRTVLADGELESRVL